MIDSVHLQNWRSHQDSVLEFKPGTNVLVGVMGSGKTSVIDAICFGLFGTFPALSNRRVTLDEIIMQKPQSASQATVRLAFSYNNKPFIVERTIFRDNKSSQAKLYCNNHLIAGPKPGEVTERIQRELHVDFNLFSRAVYSEQNQIDFFLRLSPRERKQKFDELLEIHKYETARQNAVLVANRIKRIAQDKQKWVTEQENRFNPNEIPLLLSQIQYKKQEQQNWEKKTIEFESHAIQIETEIKKLETVFLAVQALEREIALAQTRFLELEKNASRIQNQLQNKTSAELSNELQQANEQKKIQQEKKNELRKQLEKTAQEILFFSQQEHTFSEKIRELQSDFVQINQLTGQCPVCRKSLAEHEKQSLQNEIQEKRTEFEQKQSDVKQKKVSFQELHKKTQNELDNQETVLQQTHVKQTRLENQLTYANEFNRIKSALQTEEQKLIQLKKQQTVFWDENELKKLRNQFVEFKTKTAQAKQQSVSCVELILSLQTQLQTVTQTQHQLAELKTDIHTLEKTAEQLGIFSNSLQTVQATLRETLLEAINLALSDLWHKTYPYSDLRSIQIAITEGDYEIMAKNKQNQWLRVEGNLSGGERSTVALCIRIAFSLVLTQNLGWLILDEPTHNLDSKTVQELSQLLKYQLPELVGQLFIVTHDPQLENAATGCLYEIQRDKNQDGVSQPILKTAA